ncbi:MAG: hypothetical protein NDP13_00310 [Crenarchaeota archaeon]|nr:hypothetical protein [Thermoproteota archaeon]MCR8453430.1 hypothetical protein [Thermoproteota archaeon]MCR8454925.1 hypothetical protein [Thermoproteota archaeon]MCR8463162.1 hypothetical protein [Thermoproteota archaeon]MCR8470494.1 hypothetical protein [Thermoproteota archaeon]
MREYLKLIEKTRSSLLFKYVLFKCLLVTFVILYFLYIFQIIEFSILSKGLTALQYAKFGLILFVFSVVYIFILFAATLSNVYDYEMILFTSILIMSTILKANAADLSEFFMGVSIGINLKELLLMILGLTLWLSVLFSISFIAKERISYFMWSLVLILISLISLNALGHANIAIPEWPPESLAELLSNRVLVMSLLTLVDIEICSNLAFISTITSENIRKLDRIYKALHEIFAGKTLSETSLDRKEIIDTASKLKFSPLALIMLRGQSGIYALEETSGEVLSKVAGFLKSRSAQDTDFIKAALGLKVIPQFRFVLLSITSSLLLKLPLAVLSTLLAYYLAAVLSNLYPEVVEVRTPMFSLVVFLLFVLIFYLLGLAVTRRITK